MNAAPVTAAPLPFDALASCADCTPTFVDGIGGFRLCPAHRAAQDAMFRVALDAYPELAALRARYGLPTYGASA